MKIKLKPVKDKAKWHKKFLLFPRIMTRADGSEYLVFWCYVLGRADRYGDWHYREV